MILDEIKAVIFDLDGTLVDSMWMWKDIDIEFLGRYGYECPDNLQREIEGMSFSETAAYFLGHFSLPLTIEEIKQIWIQMSIEKYRNEVPLKKGAKDFLEYLKGRRIKTGIATSNGKDMVNAILASHQVLPYFDQVVTACEVASGKPSPDIYLKVASDLKVHPKDCLVFEDIRAGILAGRRAGMKVCAVADAYSLDTEEEKRALADYYIESFEELL